MADFPEYQRSVGITPAEPVLSDAYEQVGDALYGSLEKLGMNVAKNASIERATIEGVKAGKKPGRSLFPAFTASDKAFVDAYKKEEYSNVSREAESFLNKTSFEVKKNPTPESLNEFQKSASAHIKKLSSMITEENRGQFERDANSAFEAKYFRVANYVETENARRMKQSFKLNLESSSSEIQDLYASGLNEKAQEKLKTTEAYIRSQREAGFLETDDEMNALLQSARNTAETAKAQAGLSHALEEGRGAEYLSERAELPQTQKNIEINKVLSKQFKDYNSLISANSQLKKLEAMTLARQKSLTDDKFIELKEGMTEKDKLIADYRVAKINGRNFVDSNLIDYINKNKGNAVKLSNIDEKGFDAWYKDSVNKTAQLLGKEPDSLSFEEKTGIIEGLKSPVPAFHNELESAIKNGDITQANDAAAAIAYLQDENPSALRDFDKESINVGGLFRNYTQNPNVQPEEALEKARLEVASIDPTIKQMRLKRYDDFVKDKGYANLTKLNKHIASELDIKNKNVTDDLAGSYLSRMRNEILSNGDAKLSEKNVISEMKQIYQKTNINGKEQLMINAPERSMSEYGFYQDNDKARAVKDMVNQNKEYQFKFNELEWEGEEPDTSGDMFLKKLYKGDLKIKVDGVPRKIVIQDDVFSLLSPDSKPSWPIAYEDNNGIAIPLMDPNNPGEQYRWEADLEGADEKLDAYEEEQLAIANKVRLEALEREEFERTRPKNPMAVGRGFNER